MKTLQKMGPDLAPDEIAQIDAAAQREFNERLDPNDVVNNCFFLLKEGATILAMAQTEPIGPIQFAEEQFHVAGIGGVIASPKRKGYGSLIMADLKAYLLETDHTGLGFCMQYNKAFYLSCGFGVDCNLIHRFVYRKEGQTVTNTGDECVLYLASSDKFIQNLLANPSEYINLPRPPTW